MKRKYRKKYQLDEYGIGGNLDPRMVQNQQGDAGAIQGGRGLAQGIASANPIIGAFHAVGTGASNAVLAKDENGVSSSGRGGHAVAKLFNPTDEVSAGFSDISKGNWKKGFNHLLNPFSSFDSNKELEAQVNKAKLEPIRQQNIQNELTRRQQESQSFMASGGVLDLEGNSHAEGGIPTNNGNPSAMTGQQPTEEMEGGEKIIKLTKGMIDKTSNIKESTKPGDSYVLSKKNGTADMFDKVRKKYKLRVDDNGRPLDNVTKQGFESDTAKLIDLNEQIKLNESAKKFAEGGGISDEDYSRTLSEFKQDQKLINEYYMQKVPKAKEVYETLYNTPVNKREDTVQNIVKDNGDFSLPYEEYSTYLKSKGRDPEKFLSNMDSVHRKMSSEYPGLYNVAGANEATGTKFKWGPRAAVFLQGEPAKSYDEAVQRKKDLGYEGGGVLPKYEWGSKLLNMFKKKEPQADVIEPYIYGNAKYSPGENLDFGYAGDKGLSDSWSQNWKGVNFNKPVVTNTASSPEDVSLYDGNNKSAKWGYLANAASGLISGAVALNSLNKSNNRYTPRKYRPNYVSLEGGRGEIENTYAEGASSAARNASGLTTGQQIAYNSTIRANLAKNKAQQLASSFDKEKLLNTERFDKADMINMDAENEARQYNTYQQQQKDLQRMSIYNNMIKTVGDNTMSYFKDKQRNDMAYDFLNAQNDYIYVVDKKGKRWLTRKDDPRINVVPK